MPLFLLAVVLSTVPNSIRYEPGSQTITVTGDVTLGPGTQVTLTVAPGTTGPVMIVGGTLTINGGTLAVTNTAPISTGSVITIAQVNGTSAVVGTFAGLPQGAMFSTASGQWFRISYTGGDGNDVTLTAIDPPPTVPTIGPVALLLLACALGCTGFFAVDRFSRF